MSTDAFLARYTPTSGPLRLGQWQCTDADRPATRLGPQARNYQATIAVGDRIGTSTAAASGPVAALTAMLYDRGISVEISAFHQLQRRRGHGDVHPGHRRRRAPNGRWAGRRTPRSRHCAR